jgi:hypothetical protein
VPKPQHFPLSDRRYSIIFMVNHTQRVNYAMRRVVVSVHLT